MENIYNYTGIIDDPIQKRLICGRTNDIRTLLSDIYAGKSIALFGERRIGKTAVLLLTRDIINGNIKEYSDSLLDKIFQKAIPDLQPGNETSWKALYLDCSGLGSVTQDAFYKAIYSRLGISLDEAEPPILYANILKAFHHEELSEQKRVVILLDEVEALLDSGERLEIFRSLRSTIQTCPKITFVLAGAEHWHQAIKTKTSPLVNNVSTFYLKAPEPYPIETFLIGHLTQHLLEKREIEQALVEWTGHKPYYVQAICAEIADIYQDGQPLPSNWKESVEEKVINKVKPTIKAFFESDNLDDLTRKILAVLAHSPGLNVPVIAWKLGASRESIWERISDLEALDKVRKRGSNYHIVGSLLEKWGRKFQENPAKKLRPLLTKWMAAIVLLILAIWVYFYTHPSPQSFVFMFPETSVSVQMPSTLEENENGTSFVKIQNTTASDVYTLTVTLSSSDIDFIDNDSSRFTAKSIQPGEARYWSPSFTAHVPISGTTFSTDIIIVHEEVVHKATFEIPQRKYPLRKYWAIINALLIGTGTFIHKNDLIQLAMSLWRSLETSYE